MWISAEIVDKQQVNESARIVTVLYGTDDSPPLTKQGEVSLGAGQGMTTLKNAIVQQLSDFNAQEQSVVTVDKSSTDLSSSDDSIPLGPVDLTDVLGLLDATGVKVSPATIAGAL